MKTAYKIIRQGVVQTLLVGLVFGQPMQIAQAASADIADVPLAVKNSVPPNIMFTLDDSGSMKSETIPDADSSMFGFPIPGSSSTPLVDFDPANPKARFFRTAQFNRLYYDPAKRYVPWTKYDKTLMDNSPPGAALHDPGAPGLGARALDSDNTEVQNWFHEPPVAGTSNYTYYPATYFNYTGPPFATPNLSTDPNNIQGNFTRVEIKPANAPFPKAAARTDCAGATCTYNEEIQNFANWYTYYRSRFLVAYAGVGQAFANVGSGPRVGFAAINAPGATIDNVWSPGAVMSGVRPFDSAGRQAFYNTLYGPKAWGGTPLRRGLDYVGQYFERTDNRGPWSDSPGDPNNIADAYCRQSYNILMTDGYWTGEEATTIAAKANVDGSAGPTITNDNVPPVPPTYTYSPANPYSDTFSNTLADVAMYYWYRDLRPDLVNMVPTNSKDPAFWQHLVNLTVGFGVSGDLPSATIAAAFSGSPPSIAWPDPMLTETAKVDDLAHAALNSRGAYLNAADPGQFASALISHVSNIISREAGAAAVAVSNANVTGTDNASYATEYHSGTWTGDLNAYPINIVTGLPDETTPLWTAGSAQPQLDLRTPANRKIVTSTDVAGAIGGRQFQPTTAGTTTKLSPAQQTLLNTPTLSDGAAVVAYLRGDRSNETSGANPYRYRSHLLGDTVNAEPLLVREPKASYVDAGYSAFKTAKASRKKMVYQGANDGMLHAFRAADDSATPLVDEGGQEDWAYIPNLVISSLNNLSNSAGFIHKYLIDGTPVSLDVDFKNCCTSGGGEDWHTILVGGLGKGGRGYYALDVTDPTAADEAAVAAKVLWEFPNSITNATKRNEVKLDMGYSFGKPIIVKTKATGWVVLVTSGYNNGTNAGDSGGDGLGHLYVLNPKTGDLISDIETTGCATTPTATPCGLAQISAYVESTDVDNTTDFVYGGDLMGNVWRFDLSDNNDEDDWEVEKFAVLKDAGGATQPITTAPELANIKISGTDKRFVYVGTGQYMGDTDIPCPTGGCEAGQTQNTHAIQTQTMYGLVDDTSNALPDPLRDSLQAQTLTTSGSTRTSTSNTVNFATKKGWYIDLPDRGERVSTDPALAVGALTFTTNVPSSTICEPGGTSWFYILDYQNGGKLSGSTVAWSAISMNSRGKALSSRPVIIQLPSGKLVALIRKSDGTTEAVTIPVASSASPVRRMSWREIVK